MYLDLIHILRVFFTLGELILYLVFFFSFFLYKRNRGITFYLINFYIIIYQDGNFMVGCLGYPQVGFFFFFFQVSVNCAVKSCNIFYCALVDKREKHVNKRKIKFLTAPHHFVTNWYQSPFQFGG